MVYALPLDLSRIVGSDVARSFCVLLYPSLSPSHRPKYFLVDPLFLDRKSKALLFRMSGFYTFVTLALSVFSFPSSSHALPKLENRQVPANATGVTTITAPSGAQIRYKEPGKAGVCETTPGVNSYSGYIDLVRIFRSFFFHFRDVSWVLSHVLEANDTFGSRNMLHLPQTQLRLAILTPTSP